uniref:Mating pheromone receptor a2 n=1 Tax=Sporobolomyces ruberrimus TaxID=86828 RepID=G8H2M2_9BASI|nr:mating pheromone receptor a2 [Sporobolomyces ruberrimus]
MPTNLALVVCCGLLTVCNSVPLYWHFQQGNSGPIAMGVWVLVATLNDFINFVIWRNDADNRAPIWCDISVKVRIGVQIGRLAAVACIARFLADVVSPRATAITRQDRRRRAITDYSIAFGFPLLLMACHVLYQPNRFRIANGLGCTPTQVLSWPTILLNIIWGPIFSAVGVLYSTYTVYRLVRHRRDFSRVVAGAHSALTTGRFLHLLALSISYLLVGAPLSISSTISYVKTSGKYYDYSWGYIHSAWKLFPVVQTLPPVTADFYTWSDVIVGFIYLAAFGVGTEAFKKILKSVGACFPMHTRPLSPRRPMKSEKAKSFNVSLDAARERGIKVVVEQEQNIV